MPSKIKKEEMVGKKVNRWTIIDGPVFVPPNTKWICKCECGKIEKITQQHLRSNKPSKGCRDCNRINKTSFVEMIGKKIADWEILKIFIGNKEVKGFRRTNFLCRHKCGFEREMEASRFVRYLKIICPLCIEKIRKQRVLCGIWKLAKDGAIKRNIKFDIDFDETFAILEKQNFKCALSGVKLEIGKNRNKKELIKVTASLDRIDSSKGYTKDNIQWVHKYVNIMKSNFSENDFINVCKKISNFNKNKKYNKNIFNTIVRQER